MSSRKSENRRPKPAARRTEPGARPGICNPQPAIRDPKAESRKPQPPVPVIGLVGGVGAGKSTVARLMAEEGCRVVDADRIAHAVLRRPEIKARIREAFGAGVFGPDGEVDRRRLGEVVFADPAARARLEAVVHPPILARLRRAIARARAARPRAVVLDAPLILEKGLAEWCDFVVYIRAPTTVRRRRLRKARGWSLAEIQRREAAQVSLRTKARKADYTVDNGASLDLTLNQVRDILARHAPR